MSNKIPVSALIILVAFFVLFGLYASFGPSIPVAVVNTNKSEFFTSNGEGKVYAKPDVAIVQIGYTYSAPTVSAAQNKANETVNKINSELKALGIPEKDIQTTNYNISPEYSTQPTPLGLGDTGSQPKITGYNVNVNMQVKVRDFQKINQVIDVATANGANQIGGLSFTIDDPQKFQNEARKLAIADAKANANALASETGITLGKIINVYESQVGRGGNYPTMSMAKENAVAADQVPTQIEPGQTEIIVQITLSYETR